MSMIFRRIFLGAFQFMWTIITKVYYGNEDPIHFIITFLKTFGYFFTKGEIEEKGEEAGVAPIGCASGRERETEPMRALPSRILPFLTVDGEPCCGGNMTADVVDKVS